MMSSRPLTSLEQVQMAWGYILRDFRQWCKPEGKAMQAWKNAPLEKAIFACRSSMVDDSEAMLKAWDEYTRDDDDRKSTFLPVMTTAIAPIMTPPELDQVVGRASWLTTKTPHDDRIIELKAMPSAFRCQIAFFCPDTHGAMMVANQFCLYFKNESKRTFKIPFEIGRADDGTPIVDEWSFRVIENSLYPDSAMSEYKNLTIVTVDCTMVGSIPIVVGMGGDWDSDTDTGEKPSAMPTKWQHLPKNADGTPISSNRPPIGASKNPLAPIQGEQKSMDERNQTVREVSIRHFAKYDNTQGHQAPYHDKHTKITANDDGSFTFEWTDES